MRNAHLPSGVNEPLGRKVIGLAQYHDVTICNHEARTSDFM